MNTRLMARLDIKGENLIKGINLEGLRVMGDPHVFARDYYLQGADEIIYIDIVASLYGRSKLTDIVRHTARDVFIPLTVGGGIRTVQDIQELLAAGADKVAINTAAVERPELIGEAAQRFGSQCITLSVEAKQQQAGQWEVYTHCGREPSGIDVLNWVRQGVALGAGEILLTSIDAEGTRQGFDAALIRAVTQAVGIPVIASGGYGRPEHLAQAVHAGADALAFADALHYRRASFADLRAIAAQAAIPVRRVAA